jgi:hypothetical protein
MNIGLKARVVLSVFNETWIFSTDFRKIYQTLNLTNLRPVGLELFHAGGRAGGRTDMTKLFVAFRSFANAPQKAKRSMC